MSKLAFYPPEKIVYVAKQAGIEKVYFPIRRTILLGFLAGAYVALGFLVYVRITAKFQGEILGAIGSFIGASLFPLGLILVVIAGGELLTGNMMALITARLHRKISTNQMIKNWTMITLSNFMGAIFVTYLFGHYLGLTESGDYLTKTISIANEKVSESFLKVIISGIGANWLVCLAVWLAYAAKDILGKILGIWFPITAFVIIGFQHVGANMFIIPAAIFASYFTWSDYLMNFIAVLFGNFIGEAIFVGSFYTFAYRQTILKND